MIHDHNMFDDSVKHVSGLGGLNSPLTPPSTSSLMICTNEVIAEDMFCNVVHKFQVPMLV